MNDSLGKSLGENKEDDERWLWLFLKIGGVVAALWIAITVGVLFVSNGQSAESAQWGDIFGAVNALFSGLAFTGVLVTLRVQQIEIKKQNETLA